MIGRHKRKHDLERQLIELQKRHTEELDILRKRQCDELHQLLKGVLCENQSIVPICDIREFGKEDWSCLANVDGLFDRKRDGILMAIQNVYFNPMHPENMNIRRKDNRTVAVCVWKDGRWHLADLKETSAILARRASTHIWNLASSALRKQIDHDIDSMDQEQLYQKYEGSYWPTGIGLKPQGELYEKSEQDALVRHVQLLIRNYAPDLNGCLPDGSGSRHVE